jgi:hypothetical protein
MTQQSMVPSTSAALMGSGADATTLPSKLTLTRRPGSFELAWRWRDQVEKPSLLASFFALAVNVPYLMIHSNVAILALLGVGVATVSATWALNVVKVHVEQGAVRVRSAPFRWRTLELDACDVVSVEAVPPPMMWLGKREGRRYAAHVAHSLLQPRWSVAARLKSGKTKSLVRPWLRQAQAQEIAALIETELRG